MSTPAIALKIIKLAPRGSGLRDALNKALRSQFGAVPDEQNRVLVWAFEFIEEEESE